MKVLRTLLIIVAVIAGLFYGGSFLLPAEYGMERSIVINAPAEFAFEQVNNLENWPNWSPWSAMDPNMEVTYTDKKSGEGAKYEWTGPETGNGALTIVKSVPYSSIETNIVFDGSEGVATGNWVFEPSGEGTKATWKFKATASGAMERYFGAFIDKLLGDMYESGLNSLKDVAESNAANAPSEEEMEGTGEEVVEADSTSTVEE